MSFNTLDTARLTTITTDNINEINKANNSLTSLESNKANKDHTHTTFGDITVNTINGNNVYSTSSSSKICKPYFAAVGINSVMEIGKYLDFHDNDSLAADYNVRIECKRDRLSLSGISGVTDAYIEASNLKADNETRLSAVESNKADSIHTHSIADIISLQTTLDGKMPIFEYDTFDDIKNDWSNIPYPSIVFTGEGPEDLTATMIIKQYPWRSLCLSTHKKERDYIWVRFQDENNNNDWTNASSWRKIPLIKNNNLIANNLKADNETRLAAVESNKADSNHTHTEFNNLVTFKTSGTTLYSNAINVLAPNIGNEISTVVNIGKEHAKNKCGYYGYVYSETDPRLTMGLHSYNDLFQIHRDKITTSLPMTASNLKSDNETRLAAVENKIANMWNTIYPVGSMYVSMNNTSPATLFGGTWTQITDRFLYCANSSKSTGGSKKISVGQLPSHTHEVWNYYDDYNYNTGEGMKPQTMSGDTASIPNDIGYWDGSKTYDTRTINTAPTGSGEDYMPPYITVYAWYRTA